MPSTHGVGGKILIAFLVITTRICPLIQMYALVYKRVEGDHILEVSSKKSEGSFVLSRSKFKWPVIISLSNEITCFDKYWENSSKKMFK